MIKFIFKSLFLFFFINSIAYSAIQGLIQTTRTLQYGQGATCSDNYSGPSLNNWYNYYDLQYATTTGKRALRITFTGLDAGQGTYYIFYQKKTIGGGSTNAPLGKFLQQMTLAILELK